MKVLLFCLNNYAFSILEPIKVVLKQKSHDYLWYVSDKIAKDFPFKEEKYTTKIIDLESYNADVIYAPGNIVPYYLRGLKTQVFHGLAGEKKGHFRIRHYFDLYLTQGPYFTDKFIELKNKHKDFDVIETGWPKLDEYATTADASLKVRNGLLETFGVKKIILYAPTFSPKLTSAPFLLEQLKQLVSNPDYLVLLKFHPLMAEEWLVAYRKLAQENERILFQEEKNIIQFLLMADVLVSDTSSVIYEFLLLDKPVITFKNISESIIWENRDDYSQLVELVTLNLNADPFKDSRKTIYKEFHPYNDGKSALRMVEAVEEYLSNHKVPDKRKISFFRKMKTHSQFGKPSLDKS